MTINGPYIKNPSQRFFKETILPWITGFISLWLAVSIAGANQQSIEPLAQRKISFSAYDWPKGVTKFVRVAKENMPILESPDPSARYAGMAQPGEILQFLDEQTVIVFGNPLGGPSGGNRTWYKVRTLEGLEGWLAGPPYAARFETERIYPEDGGGSTFAQREILRIQKTIIFDFGSKEVFLKKGDFLFIIERNPAWVTLESMNGQIGRWREEDIIKDGNFETIPWQVEWDDIRKRKSPIVLLMLCTLLITALVPFTIYNDPEHKERGGRKAISLLYFGLIFFGLIGFSLDAFRGSGSFAAHIAPRRFDFILETIGFYLILPCGIVVTFFFEGFATFLIRCKYIFSQKSVEEAIMERTKKKEYEAKRQKYETKKEEIDTRQNAIQKRLSNLRSDLPEVIDAIPADLTDYQGYFNEVEKRFQERQIMKTTKAARERLEEVRRLCEEGAKLQRARADLEMANYEFKTVDKEISLKDKERILKDKVLDRDILETDVDIARLKRMSEKNEEREDFGV